jgi:hypothetical protein
MKRDGGKETGQKAEGRDRRLNIKGGKRGGVKEGGNRGETELKVGEKETD